MNRFILFRIAGFLSIIPTWTELPPSLEKERMELLDKIGAELEKDEE